MASPDSSEQIVTVGPYPFQNIIDLGVTHEKSVWWCVLKYLHNVRIQFGENAWFLNVGLGLPRLHSQNELSCVWLRGEVIVY